MKLKFLLMTRSFQMAKTDPKAKASVFTCVIAFMSSILVSGEKTTLKFNIALKRYASEKKGLPLAQTPKIMRCVLLTSNARNRCLSSTYLQARFSWRVIEWPRDHVIIQNKYYWSRLLQVKLSNNTISSNIKYHTFLSVLSYLSNVLLWVSPDIKLSITSRVWQ